MYIHGVTRQLGKGIPKCIDKKVHTRNDNIMRHMGKLKVAKLVGETTMKYLLAISLYDVKPFYFMKNDWAEIRWIQKHRDIWSGCLQCMIKMPYYILNVIDI